MVLICDLTPCSIYGGYSRLGEATFRDHNNGSTQEMILNRLIHGHSSIAVLPARH